MIELVINGELDNQRFTSSLDSVIYRFDIYYNYRIGAWYMDLATGNGDDVINGVKLTCSNLFADYNIVGLPAGKLFVYDNLEIYDTPGRNNFGSNRRYRLIYITEDEL